MSSSSKRVLNFCCLLLALGFAPMAVQAQSDVALEKMQAKSNNRPLASLQKAAERANARAAKAGPPREVPNFRGEGKPRSGGGTAVADALLQDSAGQQFALAGSGFYGASNNDNAAIAGVMIAPPDTDGQVGRTHFVQMINLLTTIFDKNGNILSGPFTSDAFWDGIGGNCQTYNQGDPVVLYDDVADRWLVSQFAFPDSMSSYSQCVAVSKTDDPMGAWNRYEFSFDGYGLNDYPKHGIVSDSITMMANLFKKRRGSFVWGGTFLGVMDKAAMYAGQSASLVGFNIGTSQFGFVAGDLDGAGNVPALFGTAMSTSNRFDIWRVNVNWSTEAASVSRIASLAITPFDSSLCSDSRGACIPQPQNGPKLESLSDRLMHRLQIRDFGSYRTMVTAHTVDVGNGRAGIRWYELRETNGAWSLYQEGTFGPNDGQYRWMPSAAMNEAGDIGIGYLKASTNTYVSTAAVGQTYAATGTGLLDSEELVCAAGSGVQTGVSRSGDYSSTSVDPIDDTFWHTNEVFTSTGNFQWNTFVCEFAVADNGGGGNNPPAADFDSVCTGLSCSFTDRSSDSDGSITSRSWTFGDGGASSATNPSHSYGSANSYSVTLLVADNEGATNSVSKNVTVTAANTPPVANFSFSCAGLNCSFTDNSSDPDGSIASRSWTFGDGGASSATNPSHSYGSASTYSVTLSVTDNGGAINSVSKNVTVTGGSTLSGSAVTNGKTWTATVTDSKGGNLQGNWSYNGGTKSCTGSGQCSLSGISRKQRSVTFTASGTGEKVTILKP